jgi:hypothetical protein
MFRKSMGAIGSMLAAAVFAVAAGTTGAKAQDASPAKSSSAWATTWNT